MGIITENKNIQAEENDSKQKPKILLWLQGVLASRKLTIAIGSGVAALAIIGVVVGVSLATAPGTLEESLEATGLSAYPANPYASSGTSSSGASTPLVKNTDGTYTDPATGEVVDADDVTTDSNGNAVAKPPAGSSDPGGSTGGGSSNNGTGNGNSNGGGTTTPTPPADPNAGKTWVPEKIIHHPAEYRTDVVHHDEVGHYVPWWEVAGIRYYTIEEADAAVWAAVEAGGTGNRRSGNDYIVDQAAWDESVQVETKAAWDETIPGHYV